MEINLCILHFRPFFYCCAFLDSKDEIPSHLKEIDDSNETCQDKIHEAIMEFYHLRIISGRPEKRQNFDEKFKC